MLQPATHNKAHPNCIDRWDPYVQRDSCTPLLDDGVFDLLNGRMGGNHVSPALFMGGCLDAPGEIPGGATCSVTTVGGWSRESYHRIPRECDDFAAYQKATYEVGLMLRKILDDVQDDD